MAEKAAEKVAVKSEYPKMMVHVSGSKDGKLHRARNAEEEKELIRQGYTEKK